MRRKWGMRVRAAPIWRAAAGATVFVALIGGAAPVSASARNASTSRLVAPADPAPFDVVGQLPVLRGDGVVGGWLIVNPTTRRAYEVFETIVGGGGNLLAGELPRTNAATIIQSFDLDTLVPLRRIVVAGAPVTAGSPANQSIRVIGGGEIVYAVDEVGGRLFLALSNMRTNPTFGNDAARTFDNLLVIDEDALDNGDSNAARVLPPPVEQRQRLSYHSLRGITYFERADGKGKLLLLLAAVDAPAVNESPTRPIYDNYLAQWDADTLAGDWLELLTGCSSAPLFGPGVNDNSYQLAMLREPAAIYLGCQSARKLAQVLRVAVDPSGVPIAAGQSAFLLSRPHAEVLADPGGSRLLFRTIQGGSTWWVFDAKTNLFSGAFAASLGDGLPSAGIDTTTGRLYALVPDATFPDPISGLQRPVRGGFAFGDTRLDPVPQLNYVMPELAYPARYRIVVDPPTRRVFVRRGRDGVASRVVFPGVDSDQPSPVEDFYMVLRDNVAISEQPPDDDDSTRTAQVEEVPGLTAAAFVATGSGYGTRELLVGGLEAATAREAGSRTPCGPDDREVRFGSVEAASLSDVTASASSLGLALSPSSQEDLAVPVDRCFPGTPPAGSGTSGADLSQGQFQAECVGDDTDEASVAAPGQDFAAAVTCDFAAERVHASATGALTPVPAAPVVRVGSSSSDVDVERLEGGGVRVHVDSISEGIEITVGTETGSIGAVRTEITSVAKGRAGTAKTTFVRTICGVALPGYSNPGCTSDPAQQTQIRDGLNRLLGTRGEARLRVPDPSLADGSSSGYQSAIQRNRTELFQDQTISRDVSLAVPGLELIFYRGDDPQKGAGRQIFQFAGVQASTSYGIQCLFGQTEGGACAGPPVTVDPPSSLLVTLVDEAAKPLAGGQFKVYADENGDGLLSGLEAPITQQGGLCATTADGVGDCTFAGLPAGDYVVEQTAAPAGYASSVPAAVKVPVGSITSVKIINVPSIGGVKLRLVDDSDPAVPLPGGRFELLADDGDRRAGPGDVAVAGCETAADGFCPLTVVPAGAAAAAVAQGCVPAAAGGCVLRVPLDGYVLRQAVAPAGYVGAEVVAFELTQPGALADIVVVNGRAGTAGTEGTPSSVRMVDPPAPPQPIVSSRPAPLPAQVGGGKGLSGPLGFIERAPANALRLLFGRSPGEAVLLVGAWAWMFIPCYLGERRRALVRIETTRRLAGATS